MDNRNWWSILCNGDDLLTVQIEIELLRKYERFVCETEELLNIIEAQDILSRGFIGMGKNILQEKASRFKHQVRRLKKLLEEM